jgi:Coenzyme PQQ synthesis protein D (PqqD)
MSGVFLMPCARAAGLVVREIDGETVVYDVDRHEAHCLNSVAALVWKNCNGQTTADDMVRILHESADATAGIDTVWSALSQLGKYNLLEEEVAGGAAGTLSRREAMRRAGLTVGVALPLITSLSVLTSSAVGASCVPLNGSCVQGACCTGLTCSSGICLTSVNGTCTRSSQCATTCCKREGSLAGTCQSRGVGVNCYP